MDAYEPSEDFDEKEEPEQICIPFEHKTNSFYFKAQMVLDWCACSVFKLFRILLHFCNIKPNIYILDYKC